MPHSNTYVDHTKDVTTPFNVEGTGVVPCFGVTYRETPIDDTQQTFTVAGGASNTAPCEVCRSQPGGCPRCKNSIAFNKMVITE